MYTTSNINSPDILSDIETMYKNIQEAENKQVSLFIEDLETLNLKSAAKSVIVKGMPKAIYINSNTALEVLRSRWCQFNFKLLKSPEHVNSDMLLSW